MVSVYSVEFGFGKAKRSQHGGTVSEPWGDPIRIDKLLEYSSITLYYKTVFFDTQNEIIVQTDVSIVTYVYFCIILV